MTSEPLSLSLSAVDLSSPDMQELTQQRNTVTEQMKKEGGIDGTMEGGLEERRE